MEPQAQVDITPTQGRLGGRPSLFTPDRCAKILALLRQGNYYEPACKAVGINYATFRDWMLAGQHGDPKFAQFYEDVLQAEAEAETNTLALWADHMPKDYKAARDFLARRHPSRWAEQRTLKVEGHSEATVTHTLTIGDAASLLGLISALQPTQLVEGQIVARETIEPDPD